MKEVIIFKLIMSIGLIPFVFKAINTLDFNNIFKRNTNPIYKQMFYIFTTLGLSYIVADFLSFILETMLGVIR